MTNTHDSESELQIAAAYLRENLALRRALGVADDEVLEPRFLGTGEHNRNFRFRVPTSGAEYVLRVVVAPQPFHRDQAAYEFAALQALEPSGRAPKPLFLDNSPEALGEGVLVISFCEGEQLDFDHLRPGDLHCAAQLMADIHAAPVPPTTPLFRPKNPLRTLFEECLQRFGLYHASTFEDARITRWAETFIATAQPLVDEPCPPEDRTHIINSETLPSHFLIPAYAAREAAAQPNQAGRLCVAPGSFVDWERPLIGEVAQDLAYFTSPTTTFWDSGFLFPASDVEGFLELYWRAVDGRFERGSFEQRFRAYRAMTALRSVTWCCKALLTYGAGNAKEAELRAHETGAHGQVGEAEPERNAQATTPASGYTTKKTANKLPIYLSDEFMKLLAKECFGL